PVKSLTYNFLKINLMTLILEVVYKLILTTICIISPTVIVLYCDLIDDSKVIEDKLKESLNGHVDNYHIDIIKIDNLQQYILLGLFNLCIENSTY
ncbi:MAG: hypothetical protein LUF02_11030, partial [Erysipelotrichaceae bacterium]|nr:hypothetical protein [Erysipelotrichaceae bacterium]